MAEKEKQRDFEKEASDGQRLYSTVMKAGEYSRTRQTRSDFDGEFTPVTETHLSEAKKIIKSKLEREDWERAKKEPFLKEELDNIGKETSKSARSLLKKAVSTGVDELMVNAVKTKID